MDGIGAAGLTAAGVVRIPKAIVFQDRWVGGAETGQGTGGGREQRLPLRHATANGRQQQRENKAGQDEP